MNGQRGFALVGVVMFILVLTILGLSLFSLTGYEAQFMQHSLDRSEALQAAAGGLDRACFVLSSTEWLGRVKDNLPLDGVVYAVARRGADSTGRIDFNDESTLPVMIRVKAQKNGETRFLEASYQTSPANSLYKRLMVLVDSLKVLRNDPNDGANPESNWMATRLYGEIWQNHDTLTVPNPIYHVGWVLAPGETYPPEGNPPPQPSLRVGDAPTPEASAFINAHWGAANAPGSGGTYTLDATGSPDSIKFFQTAHVSGHWSLYRTDPVTINIKGTAIWLFDRGFHSLRRVEVHGMGAPTDMLVMVAGPSTGAVTHPAWPPETNIGFALLNSIDSPGVPVVLVTDGGVLLQNRDYNAPTGDDDKRASTVNYLTVFAKFARVLGPDASDVGWGVAAPIKMIMRHDNTSADVLIDKLSERGYLPNTGGAPKGKLRLLAGSWREVTESNPY